MSSVTGKNTYLVLDDIIPIWPNKNSWKQTVEDRVL